MRLGVGEVREVEPASASVGVQPGQQLQLARDRRRVTAGALALGAACRAHLKGSQLFDVSWWSVYELDDGLCELALVDDGARCEGGNVMQRTPQHAGQARRSPAEMKVSLSCAVMNMARTAASICRQTVGGDCAAAAAAGFTSWYLAGGSSGCNGAMEAACLGASTSAAMVPESPS